MAAGAQGWGSAKSEAEGHGRWRAGFGVGQAWAPPMQAHPVRRGGARVGRRVQQRHASLEACGARRGHCHVRKVFALSRVVCTILGWLATEAESRCVRVCAVDQQ
eukprot:5808140-Prymnesium_polylepis.2